MDAVRRDRKALVSSRAGLSGVVVARVDILVEYDETILNWVVELVRML